MMHRGVQPQSPGAGYRFSGLLGCISMISTAEPATHPFRKSTQWMARQSHIGFGLMLIVVIWLAVLQLLNTERVSLKRGMVQELANLSLVFEQNVLRSIGEVDRILQTIRSSEPRDGTPNDWTAVIRRTYAIDDQTLQIAVIDAQGILVASTLGLPSGPKLDLGDREHFRVHKQSNLDLLFISKPVIGRASKKWSIQVTRRITQQDGRFGGVVVASLDPSHLSRTYNALTLGESGGLALIGTDDIIRAGAGTLCKRDWPKLARRPAARLAAKPCRRRQICLGGVCPTGAPHSIPRRRHVSPARPCLDPRTRSHQRMGPSPPHLSWRRVSGLYLNHRDYHSIGQGAPAPRDQDHKLGTSRLIDWPCQSRAAP